MGNEIDEALAAFRQYTDAFQTLDPRAAAACFHEPALTVTPRGVAALPDHAAVEKNYVDVMAELPARGYVRTDFSPLTARRLGDGLVEVTGTGTWINAKGQGFMPFGMTYVLKRDNGAWRIVVGLVHSHETVRRTG